MTALPLETSDSSMEDAARPYSPDTGDNLERADVAGLLAPLSPCYGGVASF